MNYADALKEHEDCFLTRMGLVFPGERVIYRGFDLFRDLRDRRWMEIFLLGITGRQFSENQIRLFEAIWSLGTSYPDPRIWNNRVASIAGSARSTGSLALGAAIAVSEATVYGRGPDVKAIDFLYRAANRMDGGENLADIIFHELDRHRGIAGFGRPLINADERIKPVCEFAESLGLAGGRYLAMIFEIERILLESRYRYRLNAAALGAALAADQGLSIREYYLYLTPAFVAGILPCYIEAAENPEGTFLPMSCARIEYTGKSTRSWE